MALCVNCHISFRTCPQMHEYYALDLAPNLVTVTEEWCGHEVSESDRLCQECMHLVIQEANNRIEDTDFRTGQQLGHAYICICCGISLHKRSGRYSNNLSAGSAVRDYMENHIFPRQMPTQAQACNSCMCRARGNMQKFIDQHINSEPASFETVAGSRQVVNEASGPSTTDAIYLPNYRRTADTPNHCLVPACTLDGRKRVPVHMKRLILSQNRLFVTANARVCSEHSVLFNGDILEQYEFIHSFTSTQVEDMLSLLSSAPATYFQYFI